MLTENAISGFEESCIESMGLDQWRALYLERAYRLKPRNSVAHHFDERHRRTRQGAILMINQCEFAGQVRVRQGNQPQIASAAFLARKALADQRDSHSRRDKCLDHRSEERRVGKECRSR